MGVFPYPMPFSGPPMFGSFNPSKLFAASEPGGWYDPSDLTTLFQDAAGTTPVTAVEQPVGLVLDKSRPITYGSELVSNGTFATNTTGWATSASPPATMSASVVSGAARLVYGAASGLSGQFSQGISVTAGKSYRITATVTPVTGTVNANISIRDTASSATSANLGFQPISGSGTTSIAFYFHATSTTTVYLSAYFFTTSCTIDLDDVSMREMSGNHLSQSTSTARPVLSARVNTLTRTEEFDNAVWVKNRCTVGANDQNAPDGTQTVDKFNCNVTASGGFFIWRTNNTITVPANTNLTLSIVSKKGSRNQFRLDYYSDNDGNNGAFAYFNLDTGAYVSSSTFGSGVSIIGTPTITALGSGLYRMSMVVNSNTTTANPTFYPSITSSSDFSCTSGVDFGYAWGADLRPANAGVGLPAYQRVGAATDYDTTGFPLYLKFDGTDDFLVSATINPGSVDKAQVFGGVRRMSDAAWKWLVQYGNPSTQNQSLGITIPDDANIGNTGFYARGTSTVLYSPTGNASPKSLVVASLVDLAGASKDTTIIPRINGAVSQSGGSGTTSGGGNFGSYTIGIGTSTSSPNVQLYSLILRFSATNLDAATIASTETWVNSKTRAY